MIFSWNLGASIIRPLFIAIVVSFHMADFESAMDNEEK